MFKKLGKWLGSFLPQRTETKPQSANTVRMSANRRAREQENPTIRREHRGGW